MIFGKVWRQAALTVGAALLTASFASANDTLRLVDHPTTDPLGDIKSLDLKPGDNADTIDIRGGGRGGGGRGGFGGGRGGFRGGFGGFRGGWGRGYGGFRGGWGRGYAGYGRGWGWGRRGWGWGYPRYYGGFGLGIGIGLGYGGYGGYGGYYGYPYYGYTNYYSPYSYGGYGSYYGISASADDLSNDYVSVTTIPLSSRVAQSGADFQAPVSNPLQGPVLPAPQLNPGGGLRTIPNDATVPLPTVQPKKVLPTPSVPDRAVSLPGTEKQYTYRAYGEPLNTKSVAAPTTLIAGK